MAKGGKSKKKSNLRAKLPKRLAGMKVPKALRTSGGAAAAWLSSPAGRRVAASALVAAAAMLTSDKGVRRAAKKGVSDAAAGASGVGAAIADAATDLVRRVVRGAEPEAKPTQPAAPRSSGGRSRPNAAPTRPGEPGTAH